MEKGDGGGEGRGGVLSLLFPGFKSTVEFILQKTISNVYTACQEALMEQSFLCSVGGCEDDDGLAVEELQNAASTVVPLLDLVMLYFAAYKGKEFASDGFCCVIGIHGLYSSLSFKNKQTNKNHDAVT